MKKLLGVALMATAATAAFAGTASAQVEGAFSGNVALTTDYAFRGFSQSNENPAIQGGFDWASDMFYAGTWASSIDFGIEGTAEVDFYAGVTPSVGPVDLDFGVVYYYYPGMDGAVEADMWEFKAAASISPIEALTLGAAAYYSPDFTFTVPDESGLYIEANAEFAVSEAFSISGAVGNQSVDSDCYYFDGSCTDNYTTWNVGGTFSVYGFGLDLRYVDTDLDTPLSEERFILTLSRDL